MVNIEVLYRFALSSFILKAGKHHFESHGFDIGYSSLLRGGFLSPPAPLLEAQFI